MILVIRGPKKSVTHVDFTSICAEFVSLIYLQNTPCLRKKVFIRQDGHPEQDGFIVELRM